MTKELMDDCSWHTSKSQLKTYCASRRNTQVRIDCLDILDGITIRIENGISGNTIKIDRDEAICLNKALSNYIGELI